MSVSLGRQTDELVALVRQGHIAAFVDRALQLPSADLADVLVALPHTERHRLVMRIPARLAAHALSEMPRDARPEATLVALDPFQAAGLIGELDDAAAAELLARLEPGQRVRLLSCMEEPAALDRLLVHQPWTAGALMTQRMVTVNAQDSVRLAMESVRRQATAIGDLTEIFVVDSARRLCGVLPMKHLLLAAPGSLVRDAMAPAIHIEAEADQQLVARAIDRYSLSSIPVLDRTGRLLGRVTADAVREVIIDRATADLLRFGGVSGREALDATWMASVRSRLPWLYINLLTAFAAATVVYFFKGSILRIVTLAIWMPVVAGVGGNAGTQALATSVRRLRQHPEARLRLWEPLLREVLIGAVNGVGIGLVVAALAVLLGESWKLGLVVLIAMIGNLIIAGMVGAIIPAVLRRVGRDPTLASPVLVTALTDACGFALLLGLATAMLL